MKSGSGSGGSGGGGIYSLLPTTMLDNPVVEKIKKLAEDEKGQVDRTKLWWMGFGVVFLFCAVLLLGSGASNMSSGIDARTTLKMQQSKEILKRRSEMIEDLRHDNDRLEATLGKQVKNLEERVLLYEGDLKVLRGIVDAKTKLVEDLHSENKEIKSGQDAAIASVCGQKDTTIAEREATIAEREATIAEREATIAEKEAAVEATVAEKDTAIEAVQLELAEAQTKTNTYKKMIEDKITQIESLHKKMKEHYQKVANLEQKVTQQSKKVSEETCSEVRQAEVLCKHNLSLLEDKVKTLEQWKEDHKADSSDPWRRS